MKDAELYRRLGEGTAKWVAECWLEAKPALDSLADEQECVARAYLSLLAEVEVLRASNGQEDPSPQPPKKQKSSS